MCIDWGFVLWAAVMGYGIAMVKDSVDDIRWMRQKERCPQCLAPQFDGGEHG